MSDSDDTDVLLLIPPDFFLINTSREEEIKDYRCCSLVDEPSFGRVYIDQMSSNYNFLPRNQQAELESINARLSQIEKNFSTSSEISSISNCTVRSKFGSNKNVKCPSPSKFAHSTPKCSEVAPGGEIKRGEESGVLKEIDRFLEDKKSSNFWRDDTHAAFESNFHNFHNMKSIEQPLSLPNPDLNRFSLEKCSRLSEWTGKKPGDMEPLISLSEIWGNDGRNSNLTLQEERLRRQHCEKTIQALQSKLLEYQQKFSVAIQVDKAKDSALMKHQEESSSLKSEFKNLQEKIHVLEAQNNDLKVKNDSLEKELTQAVALASKYQDKNEILEIKVESLTKASNDVGGIYKKQIEDMEIRISNSLRAEEIANEELSKMKDKLAQAQVSAEKVKNKHDALQSELDALKQEKKSTLEKFYQEKRRADNLDKENKNINLSLNDVTTKEKNLLREIEIQRSSLKSHYQQQLEKVVAQKLKEFQTQLDTVEESLKTEAKERERLIAERAIKQLEIINEKNEQEINLLLEKHREEVELYRIQLMNATKKIEEMQEKLNLYKSKRVDIAEKLHNVMETQWQKALEIIISPSQKQSFQSINSQNVDKEKLDGLKNKPENECFETPNSSRNRKVLEKEKNADRLQAYIEMLLSKSPRDLENIEEILGMPKHNTSEDRSEKPRNGVSSSKPPWK